MELTYFILFTDKRKLVNISSHLSQEGVTLGTTVALARHIPNKIDVTGTKSSEQNLL